MISVHIADVHITPARLQYSQIWKETAATISFGQHSKVQLLILGTATIRDAASTWNNNIHIYINCTLPTQQQPLLMCTYYYHTLYIKVLYTPHNSNRTFLQKTSHTRKTFVSLNAVHSPGYVHTIIIQCHMCTCTRNIERYVCVTKRSIRTPL